MNLPPRERTQSHCGWQHGTLLQRKQSDNTQPCHWLLHQGKGHGQIEELYDQGCNLIRSCSECSSPRKLSSFQGVNLPWWGSRPQNNLGVSFKAEVGGSKRGEREQREGEGNRQREGGRIKKESWKEGEKARGTQAMAQMVSSQSSLQPHVTMKERGWAACAGVRMLPGKTSTFL